MNKHATRPLYAHMMLLACLLMPVLAVANTTNFTSHITAASVGVATIPPLITDVYLRSIPTLDVVALAPSKTEAYDHTVTIWVDVSGYGDLRYQWYCNGKTIKNGKGTTSANAGKLYLTKVESVVVPRGSATPLELHTVRLTHTISPFRKGHAGDYIVKVQDDYGNELTSAVITLSYDRNSTPGELPKTGDDNVSFWMLILLMFISTVGFIFCAKTYCDCLKCRTKFRR